MTDLPLPWEGYPVRALPGKKLLLEIDINREIPGNPDFCHSVILVTVFNESERVGKSGCLGVLHPSS